MKAHKKNPAQFSVFFGSCLCIGFILALSLTFHSQSRVHNKQVLGTTVVNCTVDAAKTAVSADEQAFLGLINAYRQQNNAGPLKFSNVLNQTSAWMAQDSATRKVSGHTDSLGRDPATRMANCGYPTDSGYGENVAWATPTLDANAAFLLWKNSPPHNANMLNASFTVIGIGKDSNAGDYWVTNFGFVQDASTFTISPTPFGAVTAGLNLSICPHGLGNCGDSPNPTSIGNTNPLHKTRSVSLILLSGNNQQVSGSIGSVFYTVATQNFQGTIPTASIPSGQYIAKIQMDGYLTQQIPGFVTIVSGQSITLPPVSLLAGDVNKDNQLDIMDYNTIISCYGTKQSQQSCSAFPTGASFRADITDDGVVDGGDYNLFLRELSMQKGV